MRLLAKLILAGAVGLGALSVGDPAEAQSCFALQTELMSLQARGSGGSGGNARYERAFRDQGAVIARTEMRARQAGCFGGGGFFLFRREPDRICNTLIPRLRDMQANLAHLDQLRRQASGGNSGRIRELQGMLAARGCAVPGGGFFNGAPARERPLEPGPFRRAGGTYRTLCVRTCDGYYFPISFSTTRDRLPEDQQTCQAMCPASDAKLFFHLNPGGGPEDMVALDGQPYSSLPTAFQYRTRIESSCACGRASGISVAGVSHPPQMSAEAAALLPMPRPARGEDPETLANRFGDFVPRAQARENGASEPMATGSNGRSVRVVGPTYWGATDEKGVVLTPVPN